MDDCNKCEHISVNEYEQTIIHEKLGIFKQHYCMKYHRTLTHPAGGETRIMPCWECEFAK